MVHFGLGGFLTVSMAVLICASGGLLAQRPLCSPLPHPPLNWPSSWLCSVVYRCGLTYPMLLLCCVLKFFFSVCEKSPHFVLLWSFTLSLIYSLNCLNEFMIDQMKPTFTSLKAMNLRLLAYGISTKYKITVTINDKNNNLWEVYSTIQQWQCLKYVKGILYSKEMCSQYLFTQFKLQIWFIIVL